MYFDISTVLTVIVFYVNFIVLKLSDNRDLRPFIIYLYVQKAYLC